MLETQKNDKWDGVDRRTNSTVYLTLEDVEEFLTKKGGNFSINSWQTLHYVLVILLMAIAGITWGVKLESRNDGTEQRVTKIEQVVSKGMLPVTEEKIKQLEDEHKRLQYELNELKIIHQKLEVEIARARLGNTQKDNK